MVNEICIDFENEQSAKITKEALSEALSIHTNIKVRGSKLCIVDPSAEKVLDLHIILEVISDVLRKTSRQ